MNIDASVQTLLGDIWTFCRARMESENKKKSLHSEPSVPTKKAGHPAAARCYIFAFSPIIVIKGL